MPSVCVCSTSGGTSDDVPQQLPDNLLRVEMFFGECARGTPMGFVVHFDGMKMLESVVNIMKSEQAFIVGKYCARAGILDDRRPATRKVTKRTIADPGVLKSNARRLDATEFAARALDIGLIGFGS